MDNVFLNKMDHYLAYLAGDAKDFPDPTNQLEERMYTLCKKGLGGGSGSNNAEAIRYINDAINSGNVKEALDKIVSKVYYVKPVITTFTTSPVAGSYELGSSIDSIIFNWTYNKDMVSQSLTNCTITLNDRTTTCNTPITSNKSFTLTASDGENSVSNTKSFVFTNKVWYGSSVEGTYDDDFILITNIFHKTHKVVYDDIERVSSNVKIFTKNGKYFIPCSLFYGTQALKSKILEKIKKSC